MYNKKFEENLKVLGLNPSGELTLQTIKKTHRAKAKEFHPDKNPGKDTTAYKCRKRILRCQSRILFI
ncbi:J domain-containing protein [Leptotrichia sp. oral taxon 879]|uniref:J domain-containing protein n=1 Tax=Leptotrichia sp. oral taxon 879 TaxID=1227267 RepID=UPI0012DFAF9F